MKIFTALLLFILFNFSALAQEIRHTVYFATDQHTITPSEQKKLDTFIAEFRDDFIEKIEVNGHTDSDGSNDYNYRLSERRVNAVKKQIPGLEHGPSKISEMPYGEYDPVDVNTSSIGKQHNRRVEIVVTYERPQVMPEPMPRPIIKKNLSLKTDIEGDTVITLPKGTLIVLPKKDYIENPNCVSVIEYMDGEDVREAGMTTMSSDGTPLISGGMFDVKLCDENKCVDILVPIRTVCGQTVPFTEWTADSENAWREKTGRPLPVIMLEDQSYYKIKVCKSGRINCDVRSSSKKCKLFIPKTRIKLKDGYRIKNIQLASDEPMQLVDPIRKRKRKAVFIRTCTCSKPLINIEATNKKGETKTIEFSPLNDFDKREVFGGCKTSEVEKKILFFKIKKKTKYRKYIVREKDFE